MSSKTATIRKKPRKEQPFYGWRYLKRIGPDGEEDLEQVPLTLEDVLHPQEGDRIPQNSVHAADLRYVADVCGERESRLDHGLVLMDCIVDWGVPGLGNHCPDISVFDKLKKRPPRSYGIFRVGTHGGRCLLGVEIVSPDTRKNDVKIKLMEYHEAKVALYVIVDQKKLGGPRKLLAFRRKPTAYVQQELDGRGRVLVKQLGIRIGLENERIVCFDAETDQELGHYEQIVQALQAAEQARQTAEQARQTAEQARQTAEEALRASERRIQELEAELRRSRGRVD